MTNTYKWSFIMPSGVTALSVGDQTLQQVYTTIDWRMEGTDGTNTVDTYGQVHLGAPNPQAFIPLASVTQDNLVSWLTSAMSVEDANGVTAMVRAKAQIDAKLAAIADPPTFAGAPITSGIAC